MKFNRNNYKVYSYYCPYHHPANKQNTEKKII